jgi:hypothetical protein
MVQQPVGATTDRRPTAGAALVALGGVLIILSFFFKWGKLTGPNGSDEVKGGTAVLIAGVVLLIIGLALFVLRTRGAVTALATLAVIAGVLATLLSGVSAFTKDVFIGSEASALSGPLGQPASVIEKQLKAAVAAGQVKVTDEIGVYLALGGSVLALVGGIAALAKRPRKVTAAPAASAGWGQPQAGYGAAQPGTTPQGGYGTGQPGAPPPGGPQPGQPPQGGGGFTG